MIEYTSKILIPERPAPHLVDYFPALFDYLKIRYRLQLSYVDSLYDECIIISNHGCLTIEIDKHRQRRELTVQLAIAKRCNITDYLDIFGNHGGKTIIKTYSLSNPEWTETVERIIQEFGVRHNDQAQKSSFPREEDRLPISELFR